MKNEAKFLVWLIELVREFSKNYLRKIGSYKACSIGDCLLLIHMVNAINIKHTVMRVSFKGRLGSKLT